jgi:hypothetical protein
MGKTSFSGPVFGAKQSLIDCGPVSASTGSSAVFYGVIVPAGEDWFLTDISLYRNSTGSTNLAISVQDDSTTIGSVDIGGSSVAAGNKATFTPDSGEYQGTKVLSGSTITLSHSSHAGPNANLCVQISGFRRYVPSTSYRD